jgi:hypothetical protein
MICEECKAELLTHHEAKDRHRWIWCRSCGLLVDEHPMGRGISGLMNWLRKYDVSKSDMQKLTAIYVNGNLRDARIAAIPIVESYLARKL